MSAWADRKAAVQAEADAIASAEHDAVIAEQHAALAEKTETEVLAELDLPDPDNMQSGDDFSVFMKEIVPSALRNRALRTLWRSDPVLANVDMLVDYGEDFTGKSDPIRVIKTIYRVGKGMLPDKEETPEIDDDASDKDTVDQDAKGDEALEPDEIEAIEEIEDRARELSATAPVELPEQETPVTLAPRRRMRFDFGAAGLPATLETEMT